jgi:NF-kappa-B inhibitor-interacting Ras-like protein
MGKTYKIIVCGKKASGKTTILEQLIYNNANAMSSSANSAYAHRLSNASSLSSSNDKYFSTIEDIYVACWEKDKGIKEKLRFYDTKGMESPKDLDTINQMRHLFSTADGAVLVFSSSDSDSINCIEKLKHEIEKSKDKKEICHFIVIDNLMPTPINQVSNENLNNSVINRELIRTEIQNRFRCNVYELNTFEKRELLCKPFVDLATNITQIATKSSMNIVQSIKKPKSVFSSK